MSKLILFFVLVFCVDVVQAQTVVPSSAVNANNCGTVKFTDARDGKVYSTVRIGTQCWMAEDLRFGKCDSVKFNIYHKDSVQNQIEEGYWGVCIGSKSPEEGHLYNWQAAMNSSKAIYNKEYRSLKNSGGRDKALWQGICPEGWYLPSGGENSEFEKLANTSDFHALVGEGSSFKGRLAGFGLKTTIHNHGMFGYYWSSTHYSKFYGYSLFFDTVEVNPRYYAASKSAGLAVRCFKIVTPDSITAGTLNNLDTICAGTSVTFKGTPAKENGEVITSYEWFVNVDNAGFAVIRDEFNDSLVYSSFEAGRDYAFKRKAIGLFGEAETITMLNTVYRSPIIRLSSDTVELDDCGTLPTITTTGLWDSCSWSCADKVLSSSDTYTPSYDDFGFKAGSFNVTCSATMGECREDVSLTIVISSAVVSSTDVTIYNCGEVSFKDARDNKVYCTTKIGNQCWMGTDLKFGKSEDDGDFFNHSYESKKDRIGLGYWGVCFADTTYGGTHFYNWQGAMNKSDAAMNSVTSGVTPQWQGVCPEGWYLPARSEFVSMYDALGNIPSKVYPGLGIGEFRGTLGNRSVTGMGYEYGCYWASTNSASEYWQEKSANRFIFHKSGYVDPQNDTTRNYGHAVRCLRQQIIAGTLNDLDTICAGTSVTFKGTPAKENGEAIRSYEWFVNVDNAGFVAIRDEFNDSLVYSSFEAGKSYVFKREFYFSIFPDFHKKGHSVETRLYKVPSEGYLDIESTAVSVDPPMITIDLCNTVSFKASGGVDYTWIYPNGSYIGGDTYKPYWHNFGSAGEHQVQVVGTFPDCTRARQNVLVKVDAMFSSKHCGDSVHDSQGNYYTTKLMGDGRCWMTQNIRRTDVEYNNAYDYGNYGGSDEQNAAYYGRVYSWNVIMQNSTNERAQGLCPTGWHIPCDGEWKALEVAYGMSSADAEIVGSRGNRAYLCKESEGFNLTLGHGVGTIFGKFGYYWTSSLSEEKVWVRTFVAPDGVTVKGNGNLIGRTTSDRSSKYSLRCVRD